MSNRYKRRFTLIALFIATGILFVMPWWFNQTAGASAHTACADDSTAQVGLVTAADETTVKAGRTEFHYLIKLTCQPQSDVTVTIGMASYPTDTMMPRVRFAQPKTYHERVRENGQTHGWFEQRFTPSFKTTFSTTNWNEWQLIKWHPGKNGPTKATAWEEDCGYTRFISAPGSVTVKHTLSGGGAGNTDLVLNVETYTDNSCNFDDAKQRKLNWSYKLSAKGGGDGRASATGNTTSWTQGVEAVVLEGDTVELTLTLTQEDGNPVQPTSHLVVFQYNLGTGTPKAGSRFAAAGTDYQDAGHTALAFIPKGETSTTIEIPTYCTSDSQDKRFAINWRQPSYHLNQGKSFSYVLIKNDSSCNPMGAEQAPPSRPITGLKVLGSSPHSVSLSWDPIGGDGYEVQYESLDGQPQLGYLWTPNARVSLPQLRAGTAYRVSVLPRLGDVVYDIRKAQITVSTSYPKPRLSKVSVGERTHESIALSWPAIDGAESYQVRYWMEDKKSKTSKRLTVTSASATLENLKANRRYIIRVGYVMDGELVSGKVSEQIKAKTRKAPADSE